jgi:hypothetical protein
MIGRPVRLQWMRADEHGWDPKGPPVLLDYRADMDSEGQITRWEADIFLNEQPMQRSSATLLAAVLAKLPKFGSGPGLYNAGLGIPYSFASSRPLPPSRSYRGHPQRIRSTVPMTRQFQHSSPRLSSAPDAGADSSRDPVSSSIGETATIITPCSEQGPLRHLD